MMHGPQPYRWCATHNRLMMACERESNADNPSQLDRAGLERQERTYCPTCKVFCVLPNHCDSCGGGLVVAPARVSSDALQSAEDIWDEAICILRSNSWCPHDDPTCTHIAEIIAQMEKAKARSLAAAPKPKEPFYDHGVPPTYDELDYAAVAVPAQSLEQLAREVAERIRKSGWLPQHGEALDNAEVGITRIIADTLAATLSELGNQKGGKQVYGTGKEFMLNSRNQKEES